MSKINVLIVRAAGTNCDLETKAAFEILGARVTLRHVNELMRRANNIYDYQIVVFPGGFTYGDDIAAGKILANELKMKLRDQWEKFLKKNGLMLGVCNGFQVLVKMGVLPGNKDWKQEVTLGVNDSGKFETRWVYLQKPETNNQKPENREQRAETRSGKPGARFPEEAGRRSVAERLAGGRCVWTRGIEEIIYLPVAHGEGKFIPDRPQTLRRLIDNGQVVFQYCDEQGRLSGYPDNPNGSAAHIAGICDETGRVFGLMPHPERNTARTHHPRWTRRKEGEPADGLKIFRKGLEFLKKA